VSFVLADVEDTPAFEKCRPDLSPLLVAPDEIHHPRRWEESHAKEDHSAHEDQENSYPDFAKLCFTEAERPFRGLLFHIMMKVSSTTFHIL